MLVNMPHFEVFFLIFFYATSSQHSNKMHKKENRKKRLRIENHLKKQDSAPAVVQGRQAAGWLDIRAAAFTVSVSSIESL